jgi:HPt (histidine-containing phosphotransfer) domain-containing protein
MILVEICNELQSLVPEYLASRHRECDELEQLLLAGANDDIYLLGHRMKGSGGSIGFDEISDIGEALETAARRADEERIRKAVEQLRAYLARVRVEYV